MDEDYTVALRLFSIISDLDGENSDQLLQLVRTVNEFVPTGPADWILLCIATGRSRAYNFWSF